MSNDVYCSIYPKPAKEGGGIGFRTSEGTDLPSHQISKMGTRPVIFLNRTSLGYTGFQGKLRWFFKSDDKRIQEVLKCLHFEKDALKKIYSHLGKGDEAKGKKRFLNYVRKGQISLERIGFSKEKEVESGNDGTKIAMPKFYLVINNLKGAGGCNTFSIGFSRKGTDRAVLFSKDNFTLKLTEDILNLKGNGIASIKNAEVESGVKVTKLGGKDLFSTLEEIRSLSKIERLSLYRNIFSVLNEIHQKGLVHRDIKLDNLVWFSQGSLSTDQKVMAIDLDFVKKEGRSCSATNGTPFYFSPERMQAYIDKSQNSQAIYTADSKDDVWAAMLMICKIESGVSPSERLLSQEFLDRFNAYSHIEGMIIVQMRSRIEHLGSKSNLFEGLQANSKHPMERIVQEAAETKAGNRLSAGELLSGMDSIISSQLTEQLYSPQTSKRGSRGFLNSFKRIFN